jgi:hypothetical protein
MEQKEFETSMHKVMDDLELLLSQANGKQLLAIRRLGIALQHETMGAMVDALFGDLITGEEN